MIRKIKKCSLDHDTRYLEVEHDEIYDDGTVDHMKRIPEGKKRKVHEELLDSFKILLTHLIVRCEQFTTTELEDQPELKDKFMLTGFTIGGKDEHEGITLIGQRRLDNNAILNLVSPFTKLHPDHSNYLYRQSLDVALTAALLKIDLYLTNQQYAPDNQLSLDLDEKPKAKKEKASRKAKPVEESEEEEGEEEHDGSKLKMAVNH